MEQTMIRGIATREGYHFFHAVTSLEKLSDTLKSSRTPLRFFSYGREGISFLCEKKKHRG